MFVLLRRIYVGGQRVVVLIDENWDEWRATPTIPEEGKPWQKEILALVKDIRIADKEHDALLETRAAQQSAPQPTLNLQQVERGRIEAELRAAHASFKTRWDNIAETRWAQTENNDPREGQNSSFTTVIAGAIPHVRKLSREDLSKFRKAQRTLLDSYEQVFSLFQKAQTKGFDPFDPGVGLAGWYPNLATWQAAQRVHAIAYEERTHRRELGGLASVRSQVEGKTKIVARKSTTTPKWIRFRLQRMARAAMTRRYIGNGPATAKLLKERTK